MLVISGWQDLFSNPDDRSVSTPPRPRRRRGAHCRSVDTFRHDQPGPPGVAARETLDWLAAHLAKFPAPTLTGACVRQWARLADLPDWPPTGERVLYLHRGGKLGAAPPHGDDVSSTFRYDPRRPDAYRGRPSTRRRRGLSRVDAKLAERDDVLNFTTVLRGRRLRRRKSRRRTGSSQSDNLHFLTCSSGSARSERGRSRNVSDGFPLASTPTRTKLIRSNFDAIAHRFRSGPEYVCWWRAVPIPVSPRNLGTGELLLTGHRMVPSVHTVHRRRGTSRVLLLLVSPAVTRQCALLGERPPLGNRLSRTGIAELNGERWRHRDIHPAGAASTTDHGRAPDRLDQRTDLNDQQCGKEMAGPEKSRSRSSRTDAAVRYYRCRVAALVV